MKKRFAFAVLTFSILTTMNGYMTKAEEIQQEEESILQDYEHQHREVPEPVYRTAASSFSGGDGSESSPYEISSAEELQYLADLLADEEDTLSEYGNKNYILTEDISLNDTSDYGNWRTKRPEYDWKPIGKKTTFTGVFDGNGHTISGLYLNQDLAEDNTYDASDFYGLFAEVYDGTIKNLNMTEVYMEVSGDTSCAGALAGSASVTKILDCAIDGTIIGYDGYFGGIVGSASGTIRGCEFSGTLEAARELQNGQTYLGGIAGDFSSTVLGTETNISNGDFEGITNCVNKGTIKITKGSDSARSAGGIAGMNSARITGCINEGVIEAKPSEETAEEMGSASLSLGGIAGNVVIAAIGEDGVISDCENKGTVTADSANAGGIAGSVDLADPRYTVTIENCSNTGKVFSENHYYAGIAADIGVKADTTLTIQNCINETDFAEGDCAGIVYELVMQKGKMVLSDNSNHGTLTSSGKNAAGILCYTANMGDGWSLDIENCENTADISSRQNVGGIAGFTAYYTTGKNADTSFRIKNCKNSGNLSSPTTNGYIGGILAVDGFMQTKTEIDGCENSGNITFTKPWIMGESDLKTENEEGKKDDAKLFTLSVMGGGMVGRIGEALLLSVDADHPAGTEINKEDALVLIKNCTNTGEFSYEEPQKGDGVTEEEFQKAKEAYWKASMGGMLGDCSCTNDYSVNFENCEYNTERGIGNTDLPDVEEKE